MEFFGYFFGIFYFASGRNQTERNDNYYFLYFSAFLNIFCLKWGHNGFFFFNFWNFFAIFLEFSISRRVGTKRNGTIIIIFSHSRPFQTYFAWKKVIMVFLNLFTILLEFSILRRVGTEGTDSFYFFSFSAFSNLFWLEMKQ